MFGGLHKNSKFAIIAGCSNFGANLAGLLSNCNWDVVVIDKDANAFLKLPDSFCGLTVEGDACDTKVLENAYIKKASICVGATESDTVNSLISQIAAKTYNTKDVFARINDSELCKSISKNNIHIICPENLCVLEFEKQSALVSLAQ